MCDYNHLIGKQVIVTTIDGKSVSGILQHVSWDEMLETTVCELIDVDENTSFIKVYDVRNIDMQPTTASITNELSTTDAPTSLEYSIHIHYSSEEKEYIVRSPEFPGLSVFGDTREQALAESVSIMDEMISICKEKHEQLPIPHTLESTDTTTIEVPRYVGNILALEAEATGLDINTIAMQYITIGIAHSRAVNS